MAHWALAGAACHGHHYRYWRLIPLAGTNQCISAIARRPQQSHCAGALHKLSLRRTHHPKSINSARLARHHPLDARQTRALVTGRARNGNPRLSGEILLPQNHRQTKSPAKSFITANTITRVNLPWVCKDQTQLSDNRG